MCSRCVATAAIWGAFKISFEPRMCIYLCEPSWYFGPISHFFHRLFLASVSAVVGGQPHVSHTATGFPPSREVSAPMEKQLTAAGTVEKGRRTGEITWGRSCPSANCLWLTAFSEWLRGRATIIVRSSRYYDREKKRGNNKQLENWKEETKKKRLMALAQHATQFPYSLTGDRPDLPRNLAQCPRAQLSCLSMSNGNQGEVISLIITDN